MSSMLLPRDTLESVQAEISEWHFRLERQYRRVAELRTELRQLDTEINEIEHFLDRLRQAEKELTP